MKRQWWLLMLLTAMAMVICAGCAQAEGAQITGMVWAEREIDGIMQENEYPLAKAQVSLEKKNADGTIHVLAIQETAKDGMFAFAVSQHGEYRLSIELPSAYHFTIHGIDSAALPAKDNISVTPFFTIEDGQMKELLIGGAKSVSGVVIYAFEDVNANGGRMQSEPKIRNVLAELLYEYDGETYVIASATTDKNGEASIRDISAGDYRLRVTLPENYMIGPMGLKVNAYYNCVQPTEGQVAYTDTFTVAPKSSQGLGIGVVRTGSLQGNIWYDQDGNGRSDKNEPGLEGAKIILRSAALQLTRETTTDQNGNYSFNQLQPGDYQLTLSLPEGKIFTRPGDSKITDIARESTVNVNIQAESTFQAGKVGAMDATQLSILAYQDTLLINGTQDAQEALLPGVEITLIQDGKIVAKGVTSSDAPILFNTLRSGDVTLRFALPQGQLFSPSTTDLIQAFLPAAQAETIITVGAETQDTVFTVGAVPAASVSGRLFEDPYNEGRYQDGYALLSGFTVQAVDADGQIQAQAVTDNQGNYTLYPLLPGEFTVHFLLNDPYVATPYNDASPANNAIIAQTPEYGETVSFLLVPGESKESINAGIFRAGVVDGYVLLNRNHDDLLTNEGGMPNVTVTLLDEYGAPFSEFSYGITDENGYYYIKGVLPGTYSLLYTMPDNGAFTTPVTESREIESAPFTSESGSEIRMQNVGGVITSTLSGTVLHQGAAPVPAHVTMTSQSFGVTYETDTWEDGQYILTGLRPDTYNLEINLTDPAGFVFNDGEGSPVDATPASNASAALSIEMGQDILGANIYASLPASVHGLIYYDGDMNGKMDEGDYGAEERYFSLWRGDKMIAELMTEPDGTFTMEQLVPGEYTLQMHLENNEILVGQAAPASSLWTIPLTIEDGAYMQPISLPMLRYASVSGQFWSLDGTMNGIEGIAISLLDEQGTVVGTTASDKEGNFTFGGLLSGTYSLSAELPDGYLFAREQDLADKASMIYSQVDGAIQMLPIDVPMGDDLSGLDIGVGAMGGIGDYAWLDANGNGMQDIGESPMPGIQIELYQHGQLIASTQTNEYGFYSLSGLYPGAYEMKVTMHKELKATKHQEQFPLVASILPEEKDTTLTVEDILVPSGSRTLHYDLGFQLRKKNVYPEAMDLIPVKDWRPYTER